MNVQGCLFNNSRDAQEYCTFEKRLPIAVSQWGTLPHIPQYGHSQSEKKLGFGDKYHLSIKVHT